MNIVIKYFGLIAEITRCKEETIKFPKGKLQALLDHLYIKYPDLKEKDFQVVQHQELITNETILTGSTIALLPPFAGG